MTSETKVTDSGLGYLRVGIPVDSIVTVCEIVADDSALGEEAEPIRVISVQLQDDTVHAIVEDGKIWRVHVDTPRWQTADSLRVGTSIDRLLEDTRARGHEGEGRLYVAVESHCGLSFRVSYVPGDQEHRDVWSMAALRALPDSVRVTSVLIFGCP